MKRAKEARRRSGREAAERRVRRKQRQREEMERAYILLGLSKSTRVEWCVVCGDITSVALTYNGNRPRCNHCRRYGMWDRYGDSSFDFGSDSD